VQAPAVGGGRLLTDTRYDGQGRAYKTTNPYFNDAPVDTTLWVASDVEIPGHTVTEFDGAGRPVASVLMAGAVPKWRTTTRYGGDRVSVTPPPGGIATTTVYDARRRTVALHQHHGGSASGPADVTGYTYTAAGQLATVTDPAGNTWRYRHDLRGRQVWTDDPDKGETTSTYDAAGQLTATDDARGQILAYDYDDLGRALSIRAGGADGRPLAEWTYDTVKNAKGQPATATSYDTDGNAYTSSVLTYTARYQPRKTSVTIPESEGLLAGEYVSGVSYNPDGSVAGEAYPEAGGLFAEEVYHTYDDVGRPLTTYGGPEGMTVAYASQTQYTRYGEMQRLHLGSGTKRAWLSHYYDGPTRRIERTIVDAELPRPMQADLNYRYDPAGNLTAIADTPLERPADIQCFRYDYLRRLTEAWTPAGAPETACAADPDAGDLAGPAPYWQSFTYDLTGNRLTQVERTTTGGTTRSYAYPDPGETRPHALTSATTAGVGTQTYAYDPAGNTTARGDQRLSWDELGHLASVTDDGETTSYVYDAAGQRLIRRDPTGSTLYLGNQEIRLSHATGALTGTRYYSHGGGTIAVRAESGVAWLFGDHHGTAEIAVDSGDLTATVRRHDPFGNVRGAEPPSWPDEKGFVGGTLDASTGLTHLGAREYDPLQGKFISVDPVMDPSDPQQMNAYAYANNNPASMSDPDGRFYFVDRDGHVRAPSAKGWTPAAKKRVKQQMAKWAPVYAREASQKAAVFKASGYTPQEYAEAQRIKQKSTFDVVIEAGGEVLAEFLGINDIKNCFGNGDIGACISMVVGVIPWSKLFRLGELIGAVKKAWNAVTSFRGLQKWANNVVDAVSNARKKVTSRLTSCHSFRPDTEVRMADGSTKPIGEIELGDKLLATDPETGRTEAREVVTLHTNIDHELVDIRLNGEDGSGAGTLHTTENHPFWSEQEGAWVDAGELAAGDLLLASDGSHVTVASVGRYTGEQLMHDLTVDDVHTYYVVVDGGSDVLVHNNDSACPHSGFGVGGDGPCPKCNPTPSVKPNTGSPVAGEVPEASRTHAYAGVDSAPKQIDDGLRTGDGGDIVTGAMVAATFSAAVIADAARRFMRSRGR
jgi:RHS repeat-associated protein